MKSRMSGSDAGGRGQYATCDSRETHILILDEEKKRFYEDLLHSKDRFLGGRDMQNRRTSRLHDVGVVSKRLSSLSKSMSSVDAPREATLINFERD